LVLQLGSLWVSRSVLQSDSQWVSRLVPLLVWTMAEGSAAQLVHSSALLTDPLLVRLTDPLLELLSVDCIQQSLVGTSLCLARTESTVTLWQHEHMVRSPQRT
jgi:hypothetical protein